MEPFSDIWQATNYAGNIFLIPFTPFFWLWKRQRNEIHDIHKKLEIQQHIAHARQYLIDPPMKIARRYNEFAHLYESWPGFKIIFIEYLVGGKNSLDSFTTFSAKHIQNSVHRTPSGLTIAFTKLRNGIRRHCLIPLSYIVFFIPTVGLLIY